MKTKKQQKFSFVEFLEAAVEISGLDQTNFGRAAGVAPSKMSKLIGKDRDPKNIGIDNLNKLLSHIINSDNLRTLVIDAFGLEYSDRSERGETGEYLEHLKKQVAGLERDKDDLRDMIKRLEAENILLKKECPTRESALYEDPPTRRSGSK